MNILFICGCLEPGKDGVGDYVRRLGAALINTGHAVIIIAINEEKFTGSSCEQFQIDNNTKVQVYRLSCTLNWKTRYLFSKRIMKEFSPEIVSLQFVPYSFHNKGLPYFLPSWLKKLKQNKQIWHIMFHELWIADSRAHSIREWILRECQKVIIKNLLEVIEFQQINTSNYYAYSMLKRNGYESGVLPIFSNFPKGSGKSYLSIQNRGKRIIGVFLGSIQCNTYFIEKILQLAELIKKQLDKQLCIIHIGNNRNGKTQQLFHELSTIKNLEVHSLGFLGAADAANILASADFGLSNYPPELIHKSGSIASMLYNGLPVILLNSMANKAEVTSPGVYKFESISDIKGFINQNKDFASYYSVEQIVKKYEFQFQKSMQNMAVE